MLVKPQELILYIIYSYSSIKNYDYFNRKTTKKYKTLNHNMYLPTPHLNIYKNIHKNIQYIIMLF